MELVLQPNLPHQLHPVEALTDMFRGVEFRPPTKPYSNPIMWNVEQVRDNYQFVYSKAENHVPMRYRHYANVELPLLLDVQMETGTGKTYVYTHTIYRLHQTCGISKFIIAVPSIAIKSGTKSFLQETYVSQHFAETLGYNATIELLVLTAQKKQKKGKKFFPAEVRRFLSGSNQNSQKIQVLLVNQQLLTTGKQLTRTDYDEGPQDFFRPFDALKATHPFVIIDEPHKFARDQKAYQAIVNELAPQCVIRFGATFPDRSSGKGAKKIMIKDYGNLVYMLSSIEAFNQGLIKGVAKEHFEPASAKEEKIKVVSINKNRSESSVNMQHVTSSGTTTHTLRVGDSLGMLAADMAGLTVTGIAKDCIELSNGQEKRVGEEFLVDIFSTSYQEQMLRLALQRHFETERKNFERSIKIKTLALFFIDSVDSFRGNEADGSGAWLREMFERLLAEQIDRELQKENAPEYADFLRFSRENISDCCAGYFSKDNSDSDEEIAKEVDDILNNKKTLLSFRDEKGSWVVRRFLFSKWTLREGWDNPNIFTITKLRTSGSEISKIQEVGRGLRLPVDEIGNRISTDPAMLNYIVDFSERDFADRLVSEINESSEVTITCLSEYAIMRVAQLRGMTDKQLFIELLTNNYIDIGRNVEPGKLIDLLTEYPEFNEITPGKVIDRNKTAKNTVNVRKAKFDELRTLWEKLNEKYIIFIDKEINTLIESELPAIIGKKVFCRQAIGSMRQIVRIIDDKAEAVTSSGVEYIMSGRKITYRDFLLRINKVTSIPVTVMHKAMCTYFKDHEFHDDYINEASLSAFIARFNEWKAENLQGRFNYKSTGFTPKQTSLTNSDGTAVKEIAQGLIGVHLDKGEASEKYLYNAIAYDSPLERTNVMTEIDSVIVYGKIPRRSISIPTIADSTYSPDFMYVVQRSDGQKELNIVIETKDVHDTTVLRGNEKIKISCAEKFFEQLKLDGYEVHFRKQLRHEAMRSIIEEYMA